MTDTIKENWVETTLGDISQVQTGPFGSQLKNEQYIIGGTPVVTVEHINNFRITDFNYPSISEVNKNRLEKYLLKKGDIVFTRVGSVDLSAFVNDHQNGWVFSSRMLRVRPDSQLINSRFLSYYFQQKSFREYIINISVGATMPSINTDILKNVPVKYCPLPEQEAIAEILSSLDDKIDLLGRQNKTLEALAETLFRQCFIEEADEDWEEVALGNVTQISIGRTPPRKEFQWFSKSSEDIKWVSIKDLGEDGIFVFNTAEFLTRDAVEKFRIPVIPTDTVILSFKMTLGRVGITSEDMLSNEAIAHFKIHNEDIICKEFLFLFLKTFKYETLGSTSSIVTSINSGMIKDIPITLPEKEIMHLFQQKVGDFFNKIKENQQQIQTLQSLRDTLLPKLMSGDIRVRMDALNKVQNDLIKEAAL